MNIINHHGTVLENQIEQLLVSKKYSIIASKNEHIDNFHWFIPQYRRYKTLYNTNMRCDFLIYHPDKWPKKLLIECKWQSSPGTVDEKFPYLVLGLKAITNVPSAILLAGGGYRKSALNWLLSQKSNDLIILEGLDKIIRWGNIDL